MRQRLFAGDRRVWWVAAAVGAVMLALVAWQMLIPRDVYLGTTSTRALSPITFNAADQKLCQPDVALPGGTGQVEMVVSVPAPRTPIAVSLEGGGHKVEVTDPGPPAAGQQVYDVRLPNPWPQSADNVAGTVCVWPTAQPFTIIGAPSGFTDPPTVMGGQPNPVRMALWFRPPAGERPSYLSQLPKMLSRAAHFRPALIGPWWYWLWLVTLPVLWIAGLRLLAVGGASSARRTALAVGAIALVNFAGWALLTPAFDAPDEQEHFTAVQNIAERHADPRQGNAAAILSPEASIAMDATRIFTYYEAPDGRPPWTDVDEARWSKVANVNPRPSRTPPGMASPSATQLPPFLGPLAPASYGVLPPGYYALASPAYLAAHGGSTFAQLTAVRLTSALLGAITAMLAVLLVLELLPGRRALAAAAGLLVAFQPMFGFISGAANNDNGINMVAALVLLLVVRTLRRGFTVRRALVLGVALVAAPMMKTTGYSLFAVAVLGLAAAAWRHRSSLRLAPWLVFLVTWIGLQAVWVAIVRHYIGPPPPNIASANPDTVRATLRGDLEYFWQVFFPRLPFMNDVITFRWPKYAFIVWVQRVWGSYGWLAIEFPRWVYLSAATVCGAVLVAGVATLARTRALLRSHGFEIALLVFTPILIVFGVHAGLVSLTLRDNPPEQGRYLFPAITALAALTVGACSVFGRKRTVPVAAALIVLVIGIELAGQLMFLACAYA